MNLILLILGLGGLWLGADFVIRGSQNVARHFRISEFLIGLTAISIGTSLPEISISVAGAINRLSGIETSGIVLGDKMGSILGQITLILGIAGLGGTLKIGKKQWWREGTMLVGSLLLLWLMSFDGFLSRGEGVILMLIYVVYFVYLIRTERSKEKVVDVEEKQLNIKKPKLNIARNVLYLLGGIGLVIYSSNTVVQSASFLAEIWGIPQSVVGVLLVGSIGSSLPELAVSIQALRKRSASMSVGNLLGSNICDTLFSIGIGSSISGFLVNSTFLILEIPLIIVVTALALYFFRTKGKMHRWEATVMILIFLAYASYKIISIF